MSSVADTRKVLGLDDLTDSKTIWRCLAAELVGTLLLVLVGTSSCTGMQNEGGDNVVRIALTFAFIIATMVQVSLTGDVLAGQGRPLSRLVVTST